MVRSVRLVVILAAMAGLVSGCETGYPILVKDPQVVAQPDKVSMLLAQAADKAATSLETLAAVEQKRTPAATVPAISDAPPELARAISVNWIGPVDQITKMVANKAGYRFVAMGSAPATPVVVSIDATNKPVIEILRSIGLQLGTRADVHVDSTARVVELAYPSVAGPGDMALTGRAR